MPLSQRALHNKPSKLFVAYVARMAFRAVLFAFVLYTFIAVPERLDLTEYFGPAHGLNVVDVLFIALLADMITKFMPKANISMGSLKQFGDYQIPTIRIFRGGKEGFIAFIEESITSGKSAIAYAKDKGMNALYEVRKGSIDVGRSLLRDIPFLRTLEFQEEDLTAGEKLRSDIRHSRAKEVISALVFWVVFNGIIFAALGWFKLLSQKVLVVWCAFYFLSDMICVVLWCPVQLFVMKNRCCTTCQIFNWDGIMAVTPLLPLFFATLFSSSLVLLALAVLFRWEAAFLRHPERFDERTNLSLSCANCADKLCYIRQPLSR